MKIKTMLLCALALGCACAFGENTKDGESSGVAVQKLQTCDFLLNKDFKKNAKYYLCLFSASWCPPCRAEMPRIAKTYAESLKDDPNIELIHFSCDQNDEKALAWAKEHDVKFPVVKPKGGNPLDLHTQGIPHLFIVDANGKLIEEGHPAKLFTDEKLNALKAGEPTEPETVTEKTRNAIAKLFPGWSLDSEVPQGGRQPEHSSGFHASHRGRNNIIRLHPMNRETPVVLSRMVKLPDNNPCLALCVSSWNDDADFLLSVRVNGKDALTNRLVCTPDAVPWEDIVVPLSPWRGSSVKLEIILSANNWWCEWSHLARVDIIEADGDMRINEGKWEVDGYTWSYRAQNGEATIVAENDGRFSAVSPCPVGSITIPATIAGAKVTHIGRDAFLDCSALTSVTIPEGVSRIGRGAFHDCTGLKSIKMPSSVKIIERDAFLGCNALSSVSIPEGVTSIERGTFDWCCGLESIEIPSGVTQIGGSAFAWCKGLTSVTIPERVTDIGDSAFHGCNALTSVTISASVTNINHVAFRNTGALTTFQVDPGNRYYKSENGLLLTKDGTSLVRGVNGDATIPPSVTAIGTCAFEGCIALRSAEIPSGVKSIGPFAFRQCRGMKSVTIPSSVTDIGQEAFFGCKNLKSIAIPHGVTAIRNSTFSGTALTEVMIPVNVKFLERGAFSWCGELKSVSFPEGMTSIGRDAFYNCGKLTSLVIPSSVQRIEQGAFYGCGSLTSVTMRGERPNAPNNIFQGCGNLKAIHVPANAKSWAGMKNWHGIPLVFDGESVNERVDAPTQEMSVVANKLKSCDFLLNKDFKKNAKYYLCLFSASWCGPCRAEMPRIAKTYAESLKDDPNIELIHFSCDQNDEKALAWAKEHDVKFPVVKPKGGNPLDLRARGIPHLFIVKADGTLVEEGHPMKLFTDEKLRELKAADGGERAADKTKMQLSGKEMIDGVEWTYSIKDGKAQVDYASSSNTTGAISIPSTLGGCPVTSIRGRQYGQPEVFGKCCTLTSVTIPSSVMSIGDRAFERCTNLTNVTIQSNATSIGSFAFFGCDSLVSFVIPSGVTSIGWRAFCHCRGLTSVTIPASVKRIEREAFLSCDNLMSISVEPDNPSYSSRNGLLCSKDGSILVAGVNGDVTIPSSVTRIEDGAFDGYSGLTGVTIPSSVTRIGKRAFAICSRLTSVKIPSSVTSIGGDAFNGTPFYRNLPDGMVVLGGGVLCGYKGKCPSAVVIPSNVTSIAGEAFSERFLRRSGAGLQSVVIASSVTDIGSRAFSYCGDLANVTMLGERPNAPNNIFERCGNLKAIHVPANAKSWAGMKDWFGIPLVFGGESKAGDSWNSAQDVEYKFNYKLDDKGNAILTGVSPKPEGALVCPNIIEGHKVTGIDRGAFNGCDKMTKIMLPEHLETLPVWVSGWCIHGSIFYGCTGLSSIGISEKNPKFASVDGALYSKDKKVLFAYPKDRTEIKVCRETTSIQGDAFHSSLLFKKINIPEGISYTGGFAFSACPNLEEVIFPKGFGSINHHAFLCCPKMKKVVFLGDAPEAYWRRTASRENVFYGAARDIVVYVRKGSKGWNGKDSTDLPGRWPLDGSDSRPIRYIDEADAKSWSEKKERQGIPIVFDAKDEAAARSSADMNGVYCVVDISGGSNAEHYPVSYRDSVPEGGWGDEYKTTKIVLRRVAAGTYPMLGNRKVTFTKPFYIGIFELTQKQVKLLSGDNNRKFVFEGDMRPADCLTWDEMRGKNEEFDYPKMKEVAPNSIIGRLRAKTGLVRIDLPTSYQFGCAWNAGTDGSGRDARSTGRHYSNQCDGKGGYTSKHTTVGSYQPNEWGIYDLHGNVWEMCLDHTGNPTAEDKSDPVGPVEGAKRHLRGGCWNSVDGFVFADFVPQNKEANDQTGKTGCRIVINVEAEQADAPAQKMAVAAKKLQSCDFLLNKDFKKDAKYYLCLFSASWCGPCRAEMPRIAKTYAESLKDDPNIELIHFSCDQNDEKALVWAKEHDVKFPVVKPKGGNPLDLHTRGIPHLFIVKADGTLIEEGHPMKLFTDEKLRELKVANGGVGGRSKSTSAGKSTDLKLPYEVVDGAVVLGQRNRNGRALLGPRRQEERGAVQKYVTLKISSGELAIPGVIDGIPVRSIRSWAFAEHKELTSVTIPSGVTNIGNHAFSCRRPGLLGGSWCSRLIARRNEFDEFNGLKSFSVAPDNPSYSSRNGMLCTKDGTILIVGVNGDVAVPEGVTSIGNGAFAGCTNLTSMTIPNSVTNIGWGVFGGCSGRMSILVGAENTNYKSANGLLLSKDGKTLIVGVNGDVTIPSSVTRIHGGAFRYCKSLTSVMIPSSVTSIGDSAFSGCSALTSVTIPGSVTSIWPGAFFGCSSLTSVTIGNGVRSIGNGAFDGCNSLTSVTILGSVTNIGWEAFADCTNLARVTIPDSVTSIGFMAFSGCTNLTSVTIPGSVKSICEEAFSGCSALTSVTIPNSVTNIGWGAFFGCSSLASVTIPDSVTSIGTEAFDGTPFYNNQPDGLVILGKVLYEMRGACPASVTIPDSVTSIGNGAFAGCTNLTSVTIPGSVTSIGNGAFFGCSALTSVTIPNSVTNIDENAFGGRMTMPRSLRMRRPLNARGNEPGRFSGLKSFSVDPDNPSYSSRNGMLCTKDGSIIIVGVNGDVVILECVTSIGNGAFAGCTNLTSVTIPNSVKSICKEAFFGCSGLTSVTIPNGVTSIGSMAFSGCTGLKSVTIPDSVTNIDSRAFDGCKNIASVDVVKEGKVEKVSFQDFCKQRKLSGAEGSFGRRPLSGGLLRGRRDLREQARQEELAKEKELEAKRRAEAAAKEAEREAQRQAEREEQRKELQRLKAELNAQRAEAEKARKARETAELD